jgi:hypothetical protein
MTKKRILKIIADKGCEGHVICEECPFTGDIFCSETSNVAHREGIKVKAKAALEELAKLEHLEKLK